MQQMSAPVLGPANPFDTTLKGQNTISGHVEEHAIDGHAFRQQHKSFVHLGYAFDPNAGPSSTGGIIGDLGRAVELDFATAEQVKGPSKAARRAAKRKRAAAGELDVVDGEGAYEGPWAGYEIEADEGDVEETEEDKEGWRVEKRRRDEEVAKAKERRKTAGEEKSIFHGASSYLFVPSARKLSLNILISQARA